MQIQWDDEPAPGQVVCGTLSFSASSLRGIEWPIIDIVGAQPGPLLCVMAGVHVNEASSIEAALRLQEQIDPCKLTGRVSILPIVSIRNLFNHALVAEPGSAPDLHWSYPGRPDGPYEEALAHSLLFRWAADAEILLDLHGGDLDERMARYVVVQSAGDEEFDRQAHDLAGCFDTEFAVALAPSAMHKPGRCCTGLARCGRLALVAEAGDQGVTQADAVAWHTHGVLNVARLLGMIDGPRETAKSQVRFDRYEWITAPAAGIVDRCYAPGTWVQRGERIGTIRDFYGREVSPIVAPENGCVMMQKTSQFAPEGFWIGSLGVPQKR